jgi:hypothetical protein
MYKINYSDEINAMKKRIKQSYIQKFEEDDLFGIIICTYDN